MEDTTQQNLSAIEHWLDKKGFVVCKSNKKRIEDEVDFERKVVFLSLRSKPLYQFYSILHECGHIVLRNKKDYKKRFKNSVAVQNGDKCETLMSSIEVIEEEILAWREGENLALSMSLELNSDHYYRYASRWLMGYIVLAAVGKEHFLRVAKEESE
jgi:NOL1/NOP2/fmu family ribosome biogenesis protein